MTSREFIYHLSKGHHSIFANVSAEMFEAMIVEIVSRAVTEQMRSGARFKAVDTDAEATYTPGTFKGPVASS